MSGGGGSFLSDAVSNPLCQCDGNLGVSRPRVTTSMWEPARLVECQRVTGCSSVLNVVRCPFDRTTQGHHGMEI